MSLLRRAVVSTVGLVVVVVTGVTLASNRWSGPPGPPSPGPAVPEAGFLPATSALPVPTVDAASREQSGIGLCELMAFAAQADPALQYAAGRAAGEIDAVAAVQRDVLLSAADQVGPSEDADVLRQLASVFVGPVGAIGPGEWDESEWADALVARADPAVVAVIADLESRC